MTSALRPRVHSIRAARWSMSVVEDHWEYAAGVVSALGGLVIEVADEDGNLGYGYSAANAFGPETLDSVIGTIDVIARAQDWRTMMLLDARVRWDRLAHGSPQAKAGLELAVIDLIGRRESTPAHEVLGYGANHGVTGITRILALDDPDAMATRGHQLIKEGATGLKIKAEGVHAIDAQRVREIRDAVGDSIRLVVDANGTYTAKSAINFGVVLDECGVEVFEQPVVAHDFDGMREVREAVHCMVEADESAANINDVYALVRRRAVDSISIKLPKMGGLIASVRVAQLCQELGITFRLGAHFNSRLYESACAHLLACVYSEMPHELGEPEHLAPDPFDVSFVVNGQLTLSSRPGLAVSPPVVSEDDWHYEW